MQWQFVLFLRIAINFIFFIKKIIVLKGKHNYQFRTYFMYHTLLMRHVAHTPYCVKQWRTCGIDRRESATKAKKGTLPTWYPRSLLNINLFVCFLLVNKSYCRWQNKWEIPLTHHMTTVNLNGSSRLGPWNMNICIYMYRCVISCTNLGYSIIPSRKLFQFNCEHYHEATCWFFHKQITGLTTETQFALHETKYWIECVNLVFQIETKSCTSCISESLN